MCVLYLPFCYVIWEEVETVTYFVFLGSKNHCMWLQPWNSKTFIPWKENYDKPRKIKKGKESEIVSCSVMSKYLQPHGLYIVCQALLSMGFPRREYCSGLPFSTRGDLPDPGIQSASLYVSCTSRWILYHCSAWEAPWSYNKFNTDKNLSIYYNLFIHFSINGYLGCSSI